MTEPEEDGAALRRRGPGFSENCRRRQNYDTKHYNLAAIIAVGYKVNSERAVPFRKWATRVVEQFTIEGFAMDDERLKRGGAIAISRSSSSASARSGYHRAHDERTMSEDDDQEIRRHQQAGDANAAITTAVRVYGDEVFSFLVSRSRDEDVAADVFSQALEDLLKSMTTFEWRCSMRTWFYRLARNAAVRYHRLPAHRADRRVGLSKASELAVQVRSRTNLHRRSEVKDRLQVLREELEPDEQQLLVLRIDNNLAWSEIAQIIEDEDEPAAIERASARVRQQFQKIKAKLRKRMIAEGLLPVE